MRTIDLDATKWKTAIDFYRALLVSIGAPEWHGLSPDALVDSMIWGGINAVEPPYIIRILQSNHAPEEVRDEIELARQVLARGRTYYRSQRGVDVHVAIEIAS